MPTAEPDATLWDAELIDRFVSLLNRAAALGQIGRFQLEAAIQSVHAARNVTGKADW